MMTSNQMDHNNMHTARRRATSRGLSFGPLVTAVTFGIVALLLGVTFVGDWLRAPTIHAIKSSPSIISPNNDNVQDITNLSYTLAEDAEVVVQVLSEGGTVIRTILPETPQTAGQHVVMWDGRDSLNQPVDDGVYQLQVTGKGTVMAAQDTTRVTVDTVPPMLQLANLDNARRVGEANLNLEGITDTDAVVRQAGDSQIIPLEADGRFTIKRRLNEGLNNIQLIATDPAGNIATVSREVNLVTRPPEINIGGAFNDMWTNKSVIDITGPLPAGITMKVNGQAATILNNGTFNHEVILNEGENSILIEAMDDVGNTTTQEMLIHRKTTAPILSLNVADNSTFQQSEIQIMGKTDPGTIVSIGGLAISVSPVGEFQTTVKLAQGQNLLEVVAQDQAGNLTKRQKRINYSLTAPQTPMAQLWNNIPVMSDYLVPTLISLPIMFFLAYFFTRPVSLVLSAESPTFRPGLPHEGKYLRLALDLSKAARTTVEVKNRRGQIISTLQYRRSRRAGQQTLFWNGYDDFGRIASPGEYTVHATASTTNGNITSMLNISIVNERTGYRDSLRSRPQRDDTLTVNHQYLRPSTQRRTQRMRRVA